jgi:hypothetical protein
VADVGVVFRAWNFSCSAVEQDFTSYFEHDGDSATVEHLVFRGGNAFSHFGNAWTKVGAPQAVQMGGFSGGPAGVLPGASGYFEAPVGMPNLLDLCTGDFIGGVVYLRPTTQDCQLLGNNVANTGFNILHGAANFTVMFIGSALVNEAGLALSEGLNVTTFGRLGPNGILKTNRRVLRSGPHSNPTASAGPFRVGRGNGGSSPTLEGGIFEMWLSKRSPRGIAEFTTVNEMVLRKMGQ